MHSDCPQNVRADTARTPLGFRWESALPDPTRPDPTLYIRGWVRIMSLGYVPRERGDGMMRMTKVEAQALAAFVARVRPDWQQPGIMAAIEKAVPLGSAAAIGGALCRLAENLELRTPALLAEPGPHWSGTTVATRQPPVKCPEHPGEKAGACRECEALAVPAPEGWREK